MSTRRVGPWPKIPEPSAVFGPRLTVGQALGRETPGASQIYDRCARTALDAMARYVTEFLGAEHPDLGRPGLVCPFAREATGRDLIRLTACRYADEASIVAGLGLLRDELADLQLWPAPSAPEPHRAIIAVFPQLRGREGALMVERIQKSLKLSFVEGRLMIGQFYPGCAEPGLWNPVFHPLQSPVISLAMRDITLFDAPFMLERAEYVQAFLRAFGAAGAERIRRAEEARDRVACSLGAAAPAALGR